MHVSQLCFGTLVLGPLQKDYPFEVGGELILEALKRGVNFLDTAQLYKTYPHIRYALDRWDGKVYLATKSAAASYQDMKAAVEEALAELNRDYLDIFFLHAARVEQDVFEKRKGAVACLKEYQQRGIIGKVGIATHVVSIVELAATNNDMDIIFPLINIEGLGIVEGTRADMEKAIKIAHQNNKPIMAMKIYGGGNLLRDRQKALNYVLGLEGVDVLAIGMVTKEELLVNLDLLAGKANQELMEKTVQKTKELRIQRFCTSCGNCLDKCPNQALYLTEEKCEVDRNKCILCGYCGPYCPEFAIRIV